LSSDIIPADIKHFVIYVSKSCQREKATTQQEQEQANEIVKCNRNQVSEQTEQTDKLTN